MEDFSQHKEYIKQRIQKIFSGLDGEIEVDQYFYETTLKVTYRIKPPEQKYSSWLGSFTIELVDGGFNLFFGHVSLLQEYQNKGYGVKLHKLRLELAKMVGAKAVIATTYKENDAQNKILEFFKWNRSDMTKTHYLWSRDMETFSLKKIG